MKIHSVFIWYHKHGYFLSIIGQTYKLLKRDTVLELHSFRDRDSNTLLIYSCNRARDILDSITMKARNREIWVVLILISLLKR
jgi:hypothetical protein